VSPRRRKRPSSDVVVRLHLGPLKGIRSLTNLVGICKIRTDRFYTIFAGNQMPNAPFKTVCENCKKSFISKDKRQRFCERSCAQSFNNKKRPPVSEQQRKKASESLKLYHKENPATEKQRVRQRKAVGKATKTGKEPKNFYDMSARTRLKVLRRLDLPCSRCGWDEEVCDIHHIGGRKIPDPHHHLNLVILCPNCHRLAGRGKVLKEEYKTLEEELPLDWHKHYYG